MGALEQSIQNWGYHLPRTPLNQFSLPVVNEAMRLATARRFDDSCWGMVDTVKHSAFCLMAKNAGLLSADDLTVLADFPNRYGLHLLSNQAVKAVGESVQFKSKGLIRGVKAMRDRLALPAFAKEGAATLALACIDAQLITPADISADVARGPSFSSVVASKALNTLNTHLRESAGCDIPIGVYQNADTLYLSTSDCLTLAIELPELEVGELMELRVMLCKTLDAMTRTIAPFHTPESFMGRGSYFNSYLNEAFEEIEDSVRAASTVEEVVDFILETGIENLPFEYEFFFGDEPSDDQIEDFADNLKQMQALNDDYSYGVLDGDDNPDNEGLSHSALLARMIRPLLEQAEGIAQLNRPTKAIYEALAAALRTSLAYAEADDLLDTSEFDSSSEDGPGLFESIIVRVDGNKFEGLDSTATDSFDEMASNCCHLYVGFPMDRAVVARSAIPIMTRTGRCIALLNQVVSAFGAYHD